METPSTSDAHSIPLKPTEKSAKKPTQPVIGVLARLPLKIRIQRFVCHGACLPFCGIIALSLRYIGRFQFEDLRATRAEAKRLLSRPGPVVVCGNHLTFIDSILLIWAFADNFWYFLHYQRFTWNLPAGDVFSKKALFRTVAYLGKCVFVYRDGTLRHKGEILALAKTLVSREDVLTIFPEGRRSRSGRFEIDRLTPGAGKIIAEVPGCRVICVYLRGDRQNSHSEYPPRGSRFHLELREIEPRFAAGDRSAPAEVTRQIGATILEMERQYFERHPGRVPPPCAGHG